MKLTKEELKEFDEWIKKKNVQYKVIRSISDLRNLRYMKRLADQSRYDPIVK